MEVYGKKKDENSTKPRVNKNQECLAVSTDQVSSMPKMTFKTQFPDYAIRVSNLNHRVNINHTL
jgi:hypothetical protein